ncbi:hypothetical protein NM688_g9177 [Phlebia brevispora]|uniref:Uncharacterized protein n=1 Tax=Phlebia brevispora TaxID=194682 RepID=A0ACC1RM42_9APHY|nr:hypothetical protein NM688_g9177 [Phlebia brevispora]
MSSSTVMPKIVEPGETLSSTEYERRSGGKGANQAVAVARAGGNVTLVGAVGKDGDWIVSNLRLAGVTVTDIVTSNKEPTGRAIIQLTPEGENSIERDPLLLNARVSLSCEENRGCHSPEPFAASYPRPTAGVLVGPA